MTAHPPLAHLHRFPAFYLRRLTPELAAQIDAGDVVRISADGPCPLCGEPAGRHPAIEQHEYARYLCDGQVVKL